MADLLATGARMEREPSANEVKSAVHLLSTRCSATVWKRDTYRRTGRGKSGFELHYERKRCTRNATADGRCWQHPRDHGFMDYE